MDKQDLWALICRRVGLHEMDVLGPGSKEHKYVLEQIVERFELPIDRALRKPELAEAIATLAGVGWDATCDSRHTPSGGGDTITRTGIARLLAALDRLEERERVVFTEPPPVGRPYEPPIVQTDIPTVLVAPSWDELDRATKAHTETQDALAERLRVLGYPPRSPRADEPQFDVATETDEEVFVFEVKSITAVNRREQVRLGLGQVLDYRHALAQQVHKRVAGVVVLSDSPTEHERAFCEASGVVVLSRTEDFDGLDGLLRVR